MTRGSSNGSLTYDEVVAAVVSIHQKGEIPTILRVKEELGNRGSTTVISKFVKEYKESKSGQSNREAAPNTSGLSSPSSSSEEAVGKNTRFRHPRNKHSRAGAERSSDIENTQNQDALTVQSKEASSVVLPPVQEGFAGRDHQLPVISSPASESALTQSSGPLSDGENNREGVYDNPSNQSMENARQDQNNMHRDRNRNRNRNRNRSKNNNTLQAGNVSVSGQSQQGGMHGKNDRFGKPQGSSHGKGRQEGRHDRNDRHDRHDRKDRWGGGGRHQGLPQEDVSMEPACEGPYFIFEQQVIVSENLEAMSENELVTKIRKLEAMLNKEQSRTEAAEKMAKEAKEYADIIKSQTGLRISEVKQSMEVLVNQLRVEAEGLKKSASEDLAYYRGQLEKANQRILELMGKN